MGRKEDEEEIGKVWIEFKKTDDDELRDRLITHYLYLIKYVVGRLTTNMPSHVSSEDMYSTGIIGLIKAVEKFDLSKKIKFQTYAMLLIKGAIVDELRSLDWVPRSVHQKANELSNAQADLQQKLGRDPDDKELAKYMGMKLSDLEELFERVRPAIMLPLNADAEEDAENTPLAERIPDRTVLTSFENVDRKEFRKLLEKAVLELPEQERIVLVLYYYENLMLKEIGEIIGVSESRISQIHAKAVTRLKGRLQRFIVEFANLL